MNWSDIRLRLKALALHRRAERDLDEELQIHIDLQIERNVQRGMSREEGRQAALRAFGGAVHVAEQCRDQRGISWIEETGRDLRFAWRQLMKQKSFLALAAVTLALGIGATTAIFSAVEGVLLRPLPYRGPERLASAWCAEPGQGISHMGFALPDLQQAAARNHSFEAVAGYFFSTSISPVVRPRRLWACTQRPTCFPCLA